LKKVLKIVQMIKTKEFKEIFPMIKMIVFMIVVNLRRAEDLIKLDKIKGGKIIEIEREIIDLIVTTVVQEISKIKNICNQCIQCILIK